MTYDDDGEEEEGQHAASDGLELIVNHRLHKRQTRALML